MASVSPAQIQKFLAGVDYPCEKQELLDHAEEQGADESVLTAIRDLPVDSFNSPNDVSEAIGEPDENEDSETDEDNDEDSNEEEE